MTRMTTDITDPDLGWGGDTVPTVQSAAYLVLSEEERRKGFVRPVRRSYIHSDCGSVTSMHQDLAETYARDPEFYGYTYCAACSMHRPVDEFIWTDGGSAVGT